MHSWDHLQSPSECKIEMASHSVHKSFCAAVFPLVASCPPFAVKFTLKCEKREQLTRAGSYQLQVQLALLGDCHFYTIYFSPGLTACFLRRKFSLLKYHPCHLLPLFPLSLCRRVLICIYPKGEPFTYFR